MVVCIENVFKLKVLTIYMWENICDVYLGG